MGQPQTNFHPQASYSCGTKINKYMGWGSLGSIVKGSGKHPRVILVLPECIWNMSTVSLVLPAFDNTHSLGSPPHQVVYPPDSMVSPWVTASHFIVGNREAELKPTTFSSLLLFCFPIFPLLLSPQWYSTFEYSLLGLLLNNNNNNKASFYENEVCCWTLISYMAYVLFKSKFIIEDDPHHFSFM